MASDGKLVMNWADAMDEADELNEQQQKQQQAWLMQDHEQELQQQQQQQINSYQQEQYLGGVQSHPVSFEEGEDKRVLYISQLPKGFQPKHIQQCFYQYKVVDFLDVNVQGEIGYYVEFYNQRIAAEVSQRADELIGFSVFTELVPYADFNAYRSQTQGQQQRLNYPGVSYNGSGRGSRGYYSEREQYYDGGRERGGAQSGYYDQNRPSYPQHPPRRYEEREVVGIVPPRPAPPARPVVPPKPQQDDRIIQPVQPPPPKPVNKPNPFGDAKPVDTTNKLLEIENKKQQELEAIKAAEQQNELTVANVETIAKLNIETPSPVHPVIDHRTGPSPPSSSSIPPEQRSHPTVRPPSVQSHTRPVIIPIEDEEELQQSTEDTSHQIQNQQATHVIPTTHHLRPTSFHDDDERASQYSRGSNRSFGSRGGRGGYRGRSRGAYRGRGRARSGVYNERSHSRNSSRDFRDDDVGSEYSHASAISHYSRVSNGEVVTVARGGRGGRSYDGRSYQGRSSYPSSYRGSGRSSYRGSARSSRPEERTQWQQTGQQVDDRSQPDSRPPTRPAISARPTPPAQRIVKQTASPQQSGLLHQKQQQQQQPQILSKQSGSVRTPRSQPRLLTKSQDPPTTEVSNQFSVLTELSDD